ncbi:hypothetical protein PG985_005508 [Apiospora marii]|uniref:uncharacterized protein n=1 Tax=Apiospora marii TaxID=335849 RepID=UPI00312D14C6
MSLAAGKPQNHPSPSDLETKQDHASGASVHHLTFGFTQTQQQQRELSGTMSPKNIVFESNEPGPRDLSTIPFQHTDNLGTNRSSMCLDFQLSHHSLTAMLPMLLQHTASDPTFPCPGLVGSSGLNAASIVPKRLSKSSGNGVMSLLQRRNRRSAHRATTQNSTDRAAASHKEANSPCKSQATPCICDKVNPNTGKPCNTTFSRLYDLTRHEDTIHTYRKRIWCNLCTEKTFSRADALARHYRVCHPDAEPTIKHRRRETRASQAVGKEDKHVDRIQNDVVGEQSGQ